MPPIDHHNVGVRVLNQGVDEPDPKCPRADDGVVGLCSELALIASKTLAPER
jgi:hypothetical protein